ncbi:MAG: AAA family ATPase [Candidatus Sericytochromatia bacterium]
MENKENIYEKVSGIIERITFYSEETGYSILKVTPFDRAKEITVTVHQAQVVAGETMDFYGNWTTHPKFGSQFKAEKCISKKPATTAALEKYLGSGLIFGVGPKTAHKIVKHFGNETLEVFDEKIERLLEVPSIGKNKLEQIKNAWEEHKAIKDVMIFLQSYGISTLYSVKIYKHYGNDAIVTVSKNPYLLAKDIYGIGFFTADKIAKNMGFAPNSFERISAGIKHVLDASRENGHCYLTKEQIHKEVKTLLELDEDDFLEEAIKKLVEEKTISIREMEEEGTFYYPNSLYWDEIHVARRIKEITKTSHNIDENRVRDWVKAYCEKIKMSLSDEQFETVINVTKEPFSIVTGGPGCGKTTTTKVIVKLFEVMGKSIQLAAPTGRASQRMSEVIGKQALTIHRLLVWNPKDGKFEKNEENKLTSKPKTRNSNSKSNEPERALDVIIVDETSMLDISLTASLLKAVPDECQVIFIGDADQLPSVGAGNVLADLLNCELIKHFKLTKIFRQAQASYIITHAHEINSGITPLIQTPIKNKDLFGSKVDCLFIDSDEATQEQLKFIKKAKLAVKEVEETGIAKVFIKDKAKTVIHKVAEEIETYQTQEDFTEELDSLTIPPKIYNTDLNMLIKSKNGAEELLSVMNKIPKYSTLLHGMTASEAIIRLITDTLPKYYPTMEIQVLAPMIRGSVGTQNLNKEIQDKLNPYIQGQGQIVIGERFLRKNDRVIQSVNNYDLKVYADIYTLKHDLELKTYKNFSEIGVFNGEIGKIEEINMNDFSCIINFGNDKSPRYVNYLKTDLTEISLAYAITIHKSQGSEFPIVIIPILTQHFTMMYRNLIYTGLTRARKLAIFIGSRKALGMAVRRLDTKERQTTLSYILSEK